MELTMMFVPAVTGLIGALGSQVISAWSAIKTKKLDLLYRSKSEAYFHFMEQAGCFSLCPSDPGNYTSFLAAFEQSRLVGSQRVKNALDVLNRHAQRLRRLSGDDLVGLQMREWHDSIEEVLSSMRDDLDQT